MTVESFDIVHTKCVGCESDDKYLLSTVTEGGRMEVPEPGDTFESYECSCGFETRVVYMISQGPASEYWVPMKEYDGGPEWRQIGRGATSEEARMNALDNYERRHGFRPLPNGEPTPVEEVL